MDRIGIGEQLVSVFRQLERGAPLQILQLLKLLRPRKAESQAVSAI